GRHASGVNAGGVRTMSRHEAEIPLALSALELWHHIGNLVDDDCGFQAYGQILVGENAVDAEALQQREQRMRSLGYSHERWMDADELYARVLALARHSVGGLIAERDGAALPYRTTSAFRRKAEALGQRVIEGTRVLRIRRDGDGWAID